MLEAQALEMFKLHGCSYNTVTYQHLLDALSQRENLEQTFQLLSEMDRLGIPPNVESVRTVILLAARVGMPKLAMEMAINSQGVLGVINEEVRMGILMSGADVLNVSRPRLNYTS